MTNKTEESEEKATDKPGPAIPADPRVARLKTTINFLYDLQKMRIASGNRATGGADDAHLDKADKKFLDETKVGLEALEAAAKKHVAKRVKGVPIYEKWLVDQRGVGPMMGAVLVSEIDIHKADTVSKIWKYAGLDVMPNGQGRRRVKGQKANFNPWLKTKLVKVLADAFIKGYSRDEEGGYFFKRKGKALYWGDDTEGRIPPDNHPDPVTGAPFPWRKIYDDYKHRKQCQILEVCMLCQGSGVYPIPKTWSPGDPQPARTKTSTCSNCMGEGSGPWGRSDAHRDAASRRYMIKMFLIEFHKQWRELEDLPVRPPYYVEKLGMQEHRATG